jgi:hypothetical protein
MKEGGKNAMNMSKISGVFQGPDEGPSKFYEQLCEASCLYTSFDPEVTENQRMINAASFSQTQEAKIATA